MSSQLEDAHPDPPCAHGLTGGRGAAERCLECEAAVTEPRPENPYRTVHARMSPPGAAWDEGFASRQPEIDRLEAERDAVIEVCAAKIRERDAAIAAGQPLAEIVDYLLRCFPDDAKAEAALAAWRSVSGSSEPPKESA